MGWIGALSHGALGLCQEIVPHNALAWGSHLDEPFPPSLWCSGPHQLLQREGFYKLGHRSSNIIDLLCSL